MGKICLFPFSNFLNRAPQSNTTVTSSPVAQAPIVSTAPQLPLAGNYVTIFDLMALEQRVQTLVSGVTTSISTRLTEQFTIPTPRAQVTTRNRN